MIERKRCQELIGRMVKLYLLGEKTALIGKIESVEMDFLTFRETGKENTILLLLKTISDIKGASSF